MLVLAENRKHRHFGVVADAFEEIRAARPEMAAPRALMRQRQLAGDCDQRVGVLVRARHRHRKEQPLGIGMTDRAEYVRDRAGLDRLAGIHHRHRIAGLEDQPEIVRDEQHRRPQPLAQILDEFDDAGLHRDVERRRRLVEDQEFGVAQQRHRDHHALLLAARQLVRIGPHHPLGVRQPDRFDHFDRPPLGLGARDLVVTQRRLHQLPADPHGWIERGHRLLIDHRDLGAADFAHLAFRQSGDVAALEADGALGHAADLRQIAHHRQRDRRFAASGLADQPHRGAGHHLAREIHHRGDFAGAREEGNAEIVDFQDRIHRPQSLSDCSRRASASRLSPRTNDIIASAGGRAGWMNSRMNRLDSLIIVPQSGLSGGMPSPK